jgi:hypothetical protein
MGALAVVLKKKRLSEDERRVLIDKLKSIGVNLDTENFLMTGGGIGVYLMSKANSERLLTLLDYILKNLEQAKNEEVKENKT